MRRNIGITNVRLDLGAPSRGSAGGPAALHEASIVATLEALGHSVVAQHEILQDGTAGPGFDPSSRYLEAVTSVCVRLADAVEVCLCAGRFPLILGGDHSLSMGSVAGLVRHFRARNQELGVLWVDAHADMNTSETSLSGSLHGMPLAVLLGRGLNALTHICGAPPALVARNVVLFGVREMDAEEELLVQRSGVRVFKKFEIRQRGVDICITEALALLSGAVAGIHLSFDLDACDPTLAPGVTTPVHAGLNCSEALTICERLGRSGRLSSVEFVELNPTMDVGNRTGKLAVRLIESALLPEPHVEPATPTRRARIRRVGFEGKSARRVGILAHSLYRDMKAQGFVTGEIVSLASALLGELISDFEDAEELRLSIQSAPLAKYPGDLRMIR